MTTRWQTVGVGDSEMRVYLSAFDHDRPLPGIVVAMHGLGLDEPMFDVVHRLARAGYAVAMPDLFHRQRQDIADPLERLKAMRDEEVLADIRAAIDALSGLDAGIASLGVVGFCMGGRLSYLAASAFAEVQAAAIFYGGGIMQSWGAERSPFDRTGDIACPVIGFWGDQDQYVAIQEVAQVEAELKRLGKWHEFHMYTGARHGFINFTSPTAFNRRAAHGAWGELVGFFDENLR